jgi:hypothetical protein
VLFIEDSHEPQAGGPVEFAGVEQDRRDRDLPLELLQQREGSIEREERPDADDETEILGRVREPGHRLSYEPIEWAVVAQDLVHGFDSRLDPDGSLRLDLLFEGKLFVEGSLESFGERIGSRELGQWCSPRRRFTWA